MCPLAEIIAIDNNTQRLNKTAENISRLNLKNISLKKADVTLKNCWSENRLFDKILIDAPCSASGIIRRQPDIKLLKKPQDIAKLVKTQKAILDNLWGFLKPEGIMLYATCSVLKIENEKQIESFLERTQNAKQEIIDMTWGFGEISKQKLPCREFDGFYYAKIKKTK